MLFQTPEFLVLFIVSVIGVAILRRNRHQHLFMALLSYVFYAWLDVRFLILLLITSMVDYAAALGMDGIQLPWRKRWALSLFTVVGAILTLGFNWPMLQGAEYAHVPFSWELAFRPLTHGDWVSPAATGNASHATYAAWLSLAAVAAFALIWPPVYEWLFRAYDGERRRKAFLVTSVISNLTVLGFFKYFNFFIDTVATATHNLGVDFTRPHLEVLLPMGISFYTFVSMSYTIDAYRKLLRAETSFLRFSLFVCYYPHLVAGPIIRPENFLPTLHDRWRFRPQNVISGFHLCLNGFFKKVLIADTVAPLVEQMLGNPQGNGATSLVVMLGAFFFAVQIYCDFSGYSDIARGVSRMFGPELPLNFDYPYFATSIIDFWRTWHMSLSTWLRDYLYIPLGGGRGSLPRVYFNLMATMVLGGLWHGASANFVLWGFYQGALLCLNRFFRWVVAKIPALDAFLKTVPGTVIRWAGTMYFVLLGWLIFRINNPKDPYDFSDLAYCLKKFVFFDFNFGLAALGLGKKAPFLAATWAGVFILAHAVSFFTGRIHDRMDRWPRYLLPAVYATLAAIFFYFWPNTNAAFIYFQF
ncbi:MAG: MBOAT family protein [Planctomycetes bacterium]|nr:MBOAT family protein [Planctomycetota bacterium]